MAGQADMDELENRLHNLLSPQLFVARLIQHWIPALVAAALVFGFYYGLWRLLDRAAAAVARRAKIDKTAHAFLSTVLRYTVLALGVVNALSQLGIDTGAMLASLGVAGLTVGFAARDAMSNIISGIFIFWDRPFVVDDLIEIGDSYGRVAEITMRSTRVVTVDGRMLAIPNSQIINSVVASYTNFPTLRLSVDLTVAVSENLGRVRELLLSTVRDDPRFMQSPPPSVVVMALNDYNIALQLQAWIHDERAHIPVTFELREKCFETLRRARIEMPFETLAVHLSPTAPADC